VARALVALADLEAVKQPVNVGVRAPRMSALTALVSRGAFRALLRDATPAGIDHQSGSQHTRRLLVEAAWHIRARGGVRGRARGRADKLDDEVVEVKEWDVVRIPPGTWRGYEGGPEGLEILVFGAPGLGENPPPPLGPLARAASQRVSLSGRTRRRLAGPGRSTWRSERRRRGGR
jgi:hypothetical protein